MAKAFRFAPFIFTAIALEVAVFSILFKKGVPLFARVQEKIDRLNTIIRENFAGIRLSLPTAKAGGF